MISQKYNEQMGNYLAKLAQKPKHTNADRIRAMTDEELAKWLDNLVEHCNDGPCFNCFLKAACWDNNILGWLKQEEAGDA